MRLSLAQYRDKVAGCWLGKCIGGTLGAPFEGKRGVFDVTFYAQDLSRGPVPNDDQDLQLVWLNAAERYGRQLNAAILAEYWLSFVVPNWSEYGAGKNNLRMGLVPPFSGEVENPNRDSCGCFIRSELWACLAPGHPEIAVKLAREDGCVDHSGEGLYGEIFFAAVQSAAFATADPEELLHIGLSYLPADCGVAGAVRTARACRREGLDWRAARKKILRQYPCSFAAGTPREEMDPDIPVGPVGWDAPANIGLTVMAWLYGGGDFGQSLCIAAGCGEDADCTAGTLGATLGILLGAGGIDPKWADPVGDRIATLCIDRTEHGSRVGLSVPDTVTELTGRILRLAPQFLGRWCDILGPQGYTVGMREPAELFYRPEPISYWEQENYRERWERPFVLDYNFVIFRARLDYGGEPFVRPGREMRLTLTVENTVPQQQWLELSWHLPDGWRVLPGPHSVMSLCHRMIGTATAIFAIQPPETLPDSRYDLMLSIASRGRPTRGIIPVTFFQNAGRLPEAESAPVGPAPEA